MNIPSRRVFVIAAFLAVAGCTGPGQTSSLPVSPSSARTDGLAAPVGAPLGAPANRPVGRGLSRSSKYPTDEPILFESDNLEHAVNIYQAGALATNPAPIAHIAVSAYAYAYGLTMDKKGKLYVAIAGGPSSPSEVAIYGKGSTKLVDTRTFGIDDPWGLAIDKSGTLYVSNDGSPPSILEYPYGSKTPSVAITGQGLSNPTGLALDASGDLFIADTGAKVVFEAAPGSTTLTQLNFKDLTEPIGVAIDPTTGYLWVTDGLGNRINVYDSPTATEPSESINGQGFPYAISIANNGSMEGTVVESDLQTNEVYAYEPGSYTPYAVLNNDVEFPGGLLITQPIVRKD